MQNDREAMHAVAAATAHIVSRRACVSTLSEIAELTLFKKFSDR